MNGVLVTGSCIHVTNYNGNGQVFAAIAGFDAPHE